MQRFHGSTPITLLRRFCRSRMDDRVGVDVIEIGEDAGFEFGLGCDADVAEHRARHLGEESLDEIEPGAMLWGEHEGEPALGLAADPGFGLLGDVRRVIVEDHLDGGGGG